MKRLGLLALLLLLVGSSHSRAQAVNGNRLQVLEMDQTGVVLELRLTDFALEPQLHAGVTYQALLAPGRYSGQVITSWALCAAGVPLLFVAGIALWFTINGKYFH